MLRVFDHWRECSGRPLYARWPGRLGKSHRPNCAGCSIGGQHRQVPSAHRCGSQHFTPPVNDGHPAELYDSQLPLAACWLWAPARSLPQSTEQGDAMGALETAQSSLTQSLARGRSIIASNGGNAGLVLAEALSDERRASEAKAAGDLDEAVTESRNAAVASTAETRRFLEALIGEYSTIAERRWPRATSRQYKWPSTRVRNYSGWSWISHRNARSSTSFGV